MADLAMQANNMPAHTFWQMYGSRLVHLQWFAVRILSMVTGAGAPERLFLQAQVDQEQPSQPTVATEDKEAASHALQHETPASCEEL